MSDKASSKAPSPETSSSPEVKIEEVAAQAKAEIVQTVTAIQKGDFKPILQFSEHYILPVFFSLLLLIVAYFASSFMARLASKPIARAVDETLGRFIGKLVFYSIMGFTLLGVLGMFGVSVASFAAVIAAAGFAIGLAFQGTLSNFSAGIILLVFRPFKVGDMVSAGGVTGKIFEIDLFNTTFDTVDNRRIIIPNSQISGNTIENITYHPHRRVDVFVGVDYGADISKTRSALSEAAESLRDKLIAGKERGFEVYLLELSDSSVKWVVRFWTRTENFWSVRQELTAAIKESLDRAGLSIPFPQLDVHLKNPSSLVQIAAPTSDGAPQS